MPNSAIWNKWNNEKVDFNY